MPFAISGYVLEPIRVGQANSPFTQTPDNYIANQGAFNAAYPSDESQPRNDYLVLVTSEGTPHAGLLVDARFGWTKNEVIDRFGYAAQAGRFKPLPGAAVTVVGTLSATSNTTRLKVQPPAQAAVIPAAPYRLAVGSAGSGTTWTVVIVANEAGFTSPPSGTAELALDTGTLNWNTGDLTTYAGQLVRFQQQQFFDFAKSTGRVGFAPITLTDPLVLLNPKPGTGQFPLLRFGFGFYLVTVQVANEGLFTVPPVGTVQWALNTGRLNFNPTDASSHAGIPVYYDGVLFGTGLALPSQVLGNIAAPSPIVGLPPVGVDLIFSVPTPYHQFPQIKYLPNTSFDSGQTGVVQVDPSTGDVNFSASDQSKYTGQTVTLTFGDLPIEHGISVRFLRTPVNLDGSGTSKDVTAIYTVMGAIWADPIIGSPQVFLPSTPIQDPGFPLTVQVIQGKGTFISNNFPRLDVPSPPVGLGYYIDFDASLFFFAQRKALVIVPILQASSDVMLPDPLVLSGNLLLELETGPGTGLYNPLTIGTDALFNSTSGTVTLIDTAGEVVAEGTDGSFNGTTFTDGTANFITDGVQPGYLLEVDNTAAKGVYTITAVAATTLTTDVPSPAIVTGVTYSVRTNREVLADRYFASVQLVDPSTSVKRIRLLGTASNGPRLNIPTAYVNASGFRFGPASGNQFATVVIVPNNGAFTAPPTGTVQVSAASGDLNFAAADLGTTVYWARTLVVEVDYTMSPGLGLVQFADRMLMAEEVLLTYTTEPPSTTPPTLPGPPVTEYARFLIRKEVTQPHPLPISTLTFNIAGRPVATNPAPKVNRGGRPQKSGIQCVVDTVASTITFLADSQITDALPHGAIINPNERVYIDYYVTQAVGGENTVTVLNPPILTAAVNITETDENGDPTNSFTVNGDHTADFPAGSLLRIEKEQVYLIGSSVYPAPFPPNSTLVTLFGTQTFQSSFTAPKLYVSSGPTPITSAPLVPAYFVPETQAYEAVARGSNTFLVAGNRTLSYRTGTVVLFTDGGSTFTDFLQVSGASYDTATDRTKVMLSANALRQYVAVSQILLYSVRPVFEPPTTTVQTSEIPVLTQPFVVYRRVSGTVGRILTAPTDYTIDDSGRVVFAQPLGPLEEFSIFYTGRVVVAGINLRASYTCQVVPNDLNGLNGQTLLADYYIQSPDTFDYRVETMTNFRGEYAKELQSAASSGSSGPQTSNASQPQLFEQGRKSLYFDEKHLANQDIIARSSLLFYNTSVNLLEDYIRAVDGRVVGNNDGPFLFDGTTGAVHPPGPVTNQIDDVIQISPAPYSITFPFAVTSIGTFRKYYLPGTLSRFYPTLKNFFGVSASTPTSVAGDEILDTRSTHITLVANLHTRSAWGVLTDSTAFSGGTILKVDFADGAEPGFPDQASKYARPPFAPGMKCAVQKRDGTYINDPSTPVTIMAVAPNQITLTGAVASVADIGTTVYQVDPLNFYLLGRDYSFNGENGQVTFIPLLPIVPPNTPIIPPAKPLSGQINLINSLTAPLKIPALFGGVEDDDGDLSFPIQSPDPANEQNGTLFTEDSLIHGGTGLIRTLTTPPLVSTGNCTTNVITNVSGPFPAPVPQVNDLVRILTGVNGPSVFRRITVAGVSTVTVAGTPYTPDVGFTYEIGVSPVLTGTVAGTSTTTQLDAAAGSFATAVVGETVIFATNERRQIDTIISATSLTFTPALGAPPAPLSTWRISNSLATYGGTPGDYLTALTDALIAELALYPTEQASILSFLDQVFTNVFVSATGQANATTFLLNDVNGTFLTSAVSTSDFVYIVAGANAGIYQVQAVNSQIQLQVDLPFPATLAGISYRIVSLFGASKDSIRALFAIYQNIASLLTSAASFLTLITTSIVVRDNLTVMTAFARATLDSDMTVRDALVDARLATLPTDIDTVTNILANTDKLYDARYVWIDARINLESGLVVQQATALANRIKAQANILNQLTKLLAVEGS
jgi:hypothetical protein